MDKIFINSKGKNIIVEVPKYGEIKLIIQDGKIIRKITTMSEKVV